MATLTEVRCEDKKCNKLLMKVRHLKGYVEIKCKCGFTNVLKMGSDIGKDRVEPVSNVLYRVDEL